MNLRIPSNQKFNALVTSLFALSVATLTSGCGGNQGFQAQALTSSEVNRSGVQDGIKSGENGASDPLLQKLDFKAQHTGANSSKLAALIDTADEELVLFLPLSSFFALGEVQGESPKLPGLRFRSSFEADGSASLALHIPLKYLVDNMDWLAPARLPNGDALPAIPEGELPSINFPLVKDGDLDLHVYIGYGMAAFFVTSPFDPVIRLQVGIRDQQRSKVVGYFATVPERTGFEGGFFMSTVLPEELTRALDDHFRIE